MITKYEKFKISYNEYGILLKRFIYDIEAVYNVPNRFELIYGFPRGGLPIAVHLSHFLNIKLTLDINDVYNVSNSNILVVDDIADTGKTIEPINTLSSEDHGIIIVTMFYKPRSIVVPNYYLEKVPNNKWIIFPWEKDEEEPNRCLDMNI